MRTGEELHGLLKCKANWINETGKELELLGSKTSHEAGHRFSVNGYGAHVVLHVIRSSCGVPCS